MTRQFVFTISLKSRQ